MFPGKPRRGSWETMPVSCRAVMQRTRVDRRNKALYALTAAMQRPRYCCSEVCRLCVRVRDTSGDVVRRPQLTDRCIPFSMEKPLIALGEDLRAVWEIVERVYAEGHWI